MPNAPCSAQSHRSWRHSLLLPCQRYCEGTQHLKACCPHHDFPVSFLAVLSSGYVTLLILWVYLPPNLSCWEKHLLVTATKIVSGKGSETPLATAKLPIKPVPTVLHFQTGVLGLDVFVSSWIGLLFFFSLGIFSSQHDLKDWPCFKQINWYYQSVTSLVWYICIQGHLYLMAMVKVNLILLSVENQPNLQLFNGTPLEHVLCMTCWAHHFPHGACSDFSTACLLASCSFLPSPTYPTLCLLY